MMSHAKVFLALGLADRAGDRRLAAADPPPLMRRAALVASPRDRMLRF